MKKYLKVSKGGWFSADHSQVNSPRVRYEAEVIPASYAGRIGGVALLFGALSYLLMLFTGPASKSIVTFGVILSLTVIGLAAVSIFIPWDRFGPRSTLVLLPPAFILLIVGMYTDPMPATDGIYLVLVGSWIGLCHPRFTTAALTPVFALSYWAPLALNGSSYQLLSSTLIVTLVSVALGEILGMLRTRLERSQVELGRTAKRRFAALTRNSIDVTFILGLDDTVRYVSPGVEHRYGYRPSDIEAMSLRDFLTTHVDGIADTTLGRIIDGTYDGGGAHSTHELRLQHVDGTWIDVEATAQNLVDDPDIQGIVIHVRDIRDRKALEQDLHRRAFHDDLTGLANRAAFRQEIHAAKVEGGEISIVFMDLDGFKNVNDSQGHHQGDRLLQLAADRLSVTAPPGSVVARLGGDEFAVLVRAGIDEAEALANTFVGALSEPFMIDDTKVSVGASAGVALVGEGASEDQALSDADLAMYQSKASQSSRVSVFEVQMRDRLVSKLKATDRLTRAVENNELVLHYQPAVDLPSGGWLGAEALVRWDSPDQGLIPPSEFIGIAEESGLIIEMGRWILEQACRDSMAWPTGEGEEPKVAVNLSTRQFQDPDLIPSIAAVLGVTGLPAHRLIIEVTESILISDIESAEAKLNALRDLGIRLALDDFGTGYASLSYLQSLPFDVLKIDRSFVVNATTQARDLALLQTINRLGHDLGLRTLVEGVETEAQAMLVASLRCDMAQGYHFARPMTAQALQDQLADNYPPMPRRAVIADVPASALGVARALPPESVR